MSWSRADPRASEELDRLRAAAAETVRATKLNAIAAEVGRVDYLGFRTQGGDMMSAAEVKKFLFGFVDQTRVRATSPQAVPAREAAGRVSAVLGSLVRDLPPERRNGAVVTLLGTIASVHREHGLSLPSWFTDAALKPWSGEALACQETQDGVRETVG